VFAADKLSDIAGLRRDDCRGQAGSAFLSALRLALDRLDSIAA
jgi:hypothetical protein